MEHFLNAFNNYISEIKVLTIRFHSGDDLLLATILTITFLCPFLKCFAPYNQTISKWHHLALFQCYWPSQNHHVPKQ